MCFVLITVCSAAAAVVCRTHTLLLVDKAGRCEYVEETMISDARSANHSLSADEGPPVTSKRPSDWKTTQFDFTFPHYHTVAETGAGCHIF